MGKTTDIAKAAGVTGAGSVVAVSATAGAKVAAGAAIPTLMSSGATVVAGVGSFMPWWIGPIQSFAACSTPLAVPIVVGGSVAYGGYITYKYLKK